MPRTVDLALELLGDLVEVGHVLLADQHKRRRPDLKTGSWGWKATSAYRSMLARLRAAGRSRLTHGPYEVDDRYCCVV